MQKVCGLELQAGSQVTLEVKGKVTFKGGIDGDGIRVHPEAVLNLKGSGNLYCSGNNEKERIILSKAPLGLYYGTVGFDSFVPKAADWAEMITPEAKADYKAYSYSSGNVTHPAGGSGIGYAHQRTGTITITGDTQAPLNIVAKGFGRSAYGIGGDGANVTITNAIIDEAQGGYCTINKFTETDGVRRLVSTDSFADRFINELSTFNTTDYSEADDGADVMAIINTIKHPEAIDDTKALIFETGSKEAEGGCAIGACHNGNNTSNLYLENVQINKAIGGSKSAAIGGSYWTSSNITMKNCTLQNIIGGNSAAGIGSGRYYKSSPNPVTIKIENTSLENITGGYFAAAIGSGYAKDTLDMSKGALCTIKITENSSLTNITGGLAAAAIGTGFHQGMLTGTIDSSVTLTNVKAGPSWVDLDYANLTAAQREKYFANSGFGSGTDNRYGTLSKPQAIGYGTLYTHGVAITSKAISEDASEYAIVGRECLDTTWLTELDYKTSAIAENELQSVLTAMKSDNNIFGKFDNQFNSGGSAFTVEDQMISNPRLPDNNLSNNPTADWPDYSAAEPEPEPEPTIELIACPATVPLVAVGNEQYQGYLDVRYNSDLEGTITPYVSFMGADPQTTWVSTGSLVRITITFDALPEDSVMGSIQLCHTGSGIRSEIRKFTFSNEVSISADSPVVTLYLGNNIDYEGSIRGTFTPNMGNSPLDSTAISGSARVVEGHSNNLATGFWVRPGFEFNPSGYWEGYVHLTPGSQTLPENPNLEVSITVAGKTSTIYVPIVQG